MMKFWIGDSNEYLAVEYAKSNRSACRQCKQKIAKDQLRIGLLTDSDQMPLCLWHHIECFHFKPRHKALQNCKMVQMVCGIEDLEAKDCDKVIQYLEEELKNLLENKYKRKTKPKKDTKQEKEDSQSDQQDEKKDVKKQKLIKKTKKEDIQKEQKEQKPDKSKITKSEKTFLSSQQEKTYQEYYDKYLSMTANELKDILQKNNQPKTGTKDVLASMCADGKLLGRIPNCSSCSGGKLRFDRVNGTYKCPGYMEDTEFQHCRASFQFEEIKRLDWTD